MENTNTRKVNLQVTEEIMDALELNSTLQWIQWKPETQKKSQSTSDWKNYGCSWAEHLLLPAKQRGNHILFIWFKFHGQGKGIALKRKWRNHVENLKQTAQSFLNSVTNPWKSKSLRNVTRQIKNTKEGVFQAKTSFSNQNSRGPMFFQLLLLSSRKITIQVQKGVSKV